MSWDGERWHQGIGQPNHQPQRRPMRRFRDRGSTAAIALLLLGLALPSVDASAATQSARTLLATWSADSKVVAYQEASSQVRYGGRWSAVSHKGYLGGKARAANARGAKATLKFSGAAVSWVGPIGPTRGQARVYIDGKLARTVNSWASSFRPSRVLFQKSWKSAGSHTISVVVLGTARHPTVTLDAFFVRLDAVSSVAPVDGASTPVGTLPSDASAPPTDPTPATPGLGGAAPSPTLAQALTSTPAPTLVAAPSATPAEEAAPDPGSFLSRSGGTLI